MIDVFLFMLNFFAAYFWSKSSLKKKYFYQKFDAHLHQYLQAVNVFDSASNYQYYASVYVFVF